MANKSQGTWYVSFDLPRGRRALTRATETFPNEREAKTIRESEISRHAQRHRGHAQSSSAETDDRSRCSFGSNKRTSRIDGRHRGKRKGLSPVEGRRYLIF
jgi:hypothetical protein